MVRDTFQKEQEERQDDIELQGEQNIVQLIRRIPRQYINDGRLNKRCWRLPRYINPDIDHAPDAIG